MNIATIKTKKIILSESEKYILKEACEILHELYRIDTTNQIYRQIVDKLINEDICDFEDMQCALDILMKDEFTISELAD